jgi:hypothetical protein
MTYFEILNSDNPSMSLITSTFSSVQRTPSKLAVVWVHSPICEAMAYLLIVSGRGFTDRTGSGDRIFDAIHILLDWGESRGNQVLFSWEFMKWFQWPTASWPSTSPHLFSSHLSLEPARSLREPKSSTEWLYLLIVYPISFIRDLLRGVLVPAFRWRLGPRAAACCGAGCTCSRKGVLEEINNEINTDISYLIRLFWTLNKKK